MSDSDSEIVCLGVVPPSETSQLTGTTLSPSRRLTIQNESIKLEESQNKGASKESEARPQRLLSFKSSIPMSDKQRAQSAGQKRKLVASKSSRGPVPQSFSPEVSVLAGKVEGHSSSAQRRLMSAKKSPSAGMKRQLDQKDDEQTSQGGRDGPHSGGGERNESSPIRQNRVKPVDLIFIDDSDSEDADDEKSKQSTSTFERENGDDSNDGGEFSGVPSPAAKGVSCPATLRQSKQESPPTPTLASPYIDSSDDDGPRRPVYASSRELTIENSEGAVESQGTAAPVTLCRDSSSDRIIRTDNDLADMSGLRDIQGSRGEPVCHPDVEDAMSQSSFDSDFDSEISDEDIAYLPESMLNGTVDKGTRDGRPIRLVSVYMDTEKVEENDAILYYFSIYTNQSTIPGAGLGAFLQYMGARRIRKSLDSYKKATAILKNAVRHEPATTKPLLATKPDGRNYQLRLTGENLHGNHNCPYWPTYNRKTLSATLPSPMNGDRQAEVRVKLVGSSIEEFEELAGRPEGGIGRLGMYTPDDYDHEPGIPFIGNGCFELDAPYSPLSLKDRKSADVYSLKAFLFDDEPAGWGFDTNEQCLGRDQACDITDDQTGKPHTSAQDEIAMYVNEVGHATDKIPNVAPRLVNERTIKYYINLQHPMKAGEEVELLTNYGKHYEPTRERKGYGLRNIFNNKPSDADRGARLGRNFDARATQEKEIRSRSLPDLARILDYVCKNICEPIAEKMKAYRLGASSSTEICTVTNLQWVAFLRMQWLCKVASERLSVLEQELQDLPSAALFCGGHMLTCKAALERMSKYTRVDFNVLFGREEIQFEPESLRSRIKEEWLEELFFSMKDEIVRPFDSCFWCPIGMFVLSKLAECFANSKRGVIVTEAVLIEIVEEAEVRLQSDLLRSDSKQLSFASGTNCESLDCKFLESLGDSETSFFRSNDTVAKAVRAAVHRWFASSLSRETTHEAFEFRIDSTATFLIMSRDKQENSLDSYAAPVPGFHEEMEELTNLPINRLWYKIWQIAYPVTLFAERCSIEPRSIHAKVATSLQVAEEDIAFSVEVGMKPGKDSLVYGLSNKARQIGHDRCRQRVRRARVERRNKRSTILKEEHLQRHTYVREHNEKQKAKEKRSNNRLGWEGGSRPSATEIYRGPPKVRLKYKDKEMEWPAGWTQATFRRQSGDSKGQTDDYFYTPAGRKLRSRKDVFNFLEQLAQAGGNESELSSFKAA